MAQFYKEKPNRSKQLSAKLKLTVKQLDHLGAGIAQHQGKVVFVPGALPGEEVIVQLTEQKKNYAHAKLIKISQASTQRQTPQCEFYHRCGGCDLQHLTVNAQRTHKAQTLDNLMEKALGAHIETEVIVADQEWAYRRKARLAIWFNKHDKTITLGFREHNSRKVIAVSHCPVLSPVLSALISPVSRALNELSVSNALGHLEMIDADNGIYLVLRTTRNLSKSDCIKLACFAEQHQLTLLLQDNEGVCVPVRKEDSELQYQLPHYQLPQSLSLAFTPGNFIQVNGSVNQQMVSLALSWLTAKCDERILDLFCGMGNFSLPLAQQGADVIGVEGVPTMVEQARANAIANGIDSVQFYHADLSDNLAKEPWLGKIDKLLLDPARAGAYEVLQQLTVLQPKQVVYVSCNPASLARDSQLLIEQGYQLTKLGLIDMFPQTHHIEAIALFELESN